MLQNISGNPRQRRYSDYLCALCMLYLDQFDRAFELITRAIREYPDEIAFSEMMAYFHLKSAESAEVFTANLVVLGLNERSLKTRRLFECAMREHSFTEFQKKARISECVTRIPPPRESLFKRPSSSRKIKISPAVIVKTALITLPVIVVVVALLYFNSGTSLFHMDKSGSKYDSLFSEDESALRRYPAIEISAEKAVYHYDSSEALLADYSLARKKIKNGDANGGIVLANKILHSNASVHLKERAAFIKNFTLAIEDRNSSIISIRELLDDPLLYNGTRIRLKGKAANVRYKNNATTFTLLVDARGDTFECTAEVVFHSQIQLNDGENTEIEVTFLHAVREGKALVVEGLRKISGGGT